MVKYKLTKTYPGSPELGTIVYSVIINNKINHYQNDELILAFKLNQIENNSEYWEEVKELTLLEEAKLRYPAGTKFIPTVRPSRDTNTSIGNFRDSGEFIVCSQTSDSVYNKISKKWAEIVEEVFVLPEKWCIKQNINKEVCDWFNNNGTHSAHINGSWTYLNYPYINGYYSNEIKPGFTEITFEQFKKYVLKEEAAVEKDYEILSVLLQRSDKHQIHNVSEYKNTGYIKALLNCNGNKIHSVKRISDGEVFTIGDKCNLYNGNGYRNPIIYIELTKNGTLGHLKEYRDRETIKITLGTGYTSLDSWGPFEFDKIVKSKIPLFTTEDGVDIFEGDTFYYVKFIQYNNTLGKPFEIVKGDHPSFKYEPQYEKYFSTKEVAEEYILMNKPCLSLSDVWDNLKVKDQKEVLKFVKSKLNK